MTAPWPLRLLCGLGALLAAPGALLVLAAVYVAAVLDERAQRRAELR